MSFNSEYKYLSDSKFFDSKGLKCPVADDDLIEVLAKSDFAKPKRSWAKMSSRIVQLPECPAFESCRALMHQQAVSE